MALVFGVSIKQQERESPNLQENCEKGEKGEKTIYLNSSVTFQIMVQDVSDVFRVIEQRGFDVPKSQ